MHCDAKRSLTFFSPVTLLSSCAAFPMTISSERAGRERWLPRSGVTVGCRDCEEAGAGRERWRRRAAESTGTETPSARCTCAAGSSDHRPGRRAMHATNPTASPRAPTPAALGADGGQRRSGVRFTSRRAVTRFVGVALAWSRAARILGKKKCDSLWSFFLFMSRILIF
jgi:hypothetical protein